MINQQVMQGSWTELKGQIKERWGQLTDDELTEVQGNAQRLVGLIQRKTGEAKEKVEQELDQLLSSGASLASRTAAAGSTRLLTPCPTTRASPNGAL